MCEGSQYKSYLIAAIIIFIVYGIGLPCLDAFLLYYKRNELKKGETIIELRFLYQGYKPKRAWWYAFLCEKV